MRIDVLLILPSSGYDPTEAAVPWAALRSAGIDVRVATPDGAPAYADERLVARGFGWLSPMLMTRPNALERYDELLTDPAFRAPLAYDDVDPDAVGGLLIPGGHAPGMRSMLESPAAQNLVCSALSADRPVGAVCHGVLLLARAIDPATNRSVLYGRRTTALTAWMELSAWLITAPRLGRYYRTYPQTVQSEVTAALADPDDFLAGPRRSARDTPDDLRRGFTVLDRNYLSARWPGDCNSFAARFVELVLTGGDRIGGPVRRCE